MCIRDRSWVSAEPRIGFNPSGKWVQACDGVTPNAESGLKAWPAGTALIETHAESNIEAAIQAEIFFMEYVNFSFPLVK